MSKLHESTRKKQWQIIMILLLLCTIVLLRCNNSSTAASNIKQQQQQQAALLPLNPDHQSNGGQQHHAMPARLDPELHSTGDHPHQTVPKRVARSAEIPSIGNSLPVVRARWPLTLFAESICCEALMAARGETSTGRDSQCHMYKRLRRTTIRKPVLQMAAKSTPHIQQPSFAEFGVEWAESADDFAPALSSHLNPVTVHLYDNFEKGLPKAGAKDHNMAQGRAGKFAGTMDNARKRWSNFGYTPVLHKGLFTSSLFAQPPPRNLIGVHSDGDLYVSIYEVRGSLCTHHYALLAAP